jgi:hypothetical protein
MGTQYLIQQTTRLECGGRCSRFQEAAAIAALFGARSSCRIVHVDEWGGGTERVMQRPYCDYADSPRYLPARFWGGKTSSGT